MITSLQNSLSVEVEEMEQNNQISLSVERKRGTFGRLTVQWAANGSLADIYPTSGVVSEPCPPSNISYITVCIGNMFENEMLTKINNSKN